MAWSVDQIYSFTKFLVNKYQSNTISAESLFYAWNSQQRMYISDLIGRFQRNNNGKGAANTGLIENEVILTKLLPFTIPVTLTVTAGQATKPTGFIYNLAARIDGEVVIMVNK